jgi:hypothetical protein
MSTGTTVIVIIVILVVVAIIAGVMYDVRRRRLRHRFGPEYDRLVEEKGSRTKAEAELAGRQRRVKDLDIRPLDAAAQARYAESWAGVQEQFVDAPREAALAAQRLVMTVMSERGYPTEGSDQVLADLSVEHANVLDHYRAASDVSQQAGDGMASTEDLRQAMIHYRALFQDLLGVAPQTVPTAAATPVTEITPGLPGDDAPAAEDKPTTAAVPETIAAAPEPTAGTGTAVDAGPAGEPADLSDVRRQRQT